MHLYLNLNLLQRGNEMFFMLEGRVEVLVPLARPGPRMLKRVAYMEKVLLESILTSSSSVWSIELFPRRKHRN